MEQRIAIVTEDGEKISSHFGMAPIYQVFTVEDGQVIAEEQREKPHHERHPDQHRDKQEHQGGNAANLELHEVQDINLHDRDHQSPDRGHQAMFAPVADCQVLICGGMGTPAHQGALAAGLEVVLVGGKLRPVLDAYLRGEIQSDMRRVH
jgi:predicted Fe-Mo cluster-binding NifX family protein